MKVGNLPGRPLQPPKPRPKNQKEKGDTNGGGKEEYEAQIKDFFKEKSMNVSRSVSANVGLFILHDIGSSIEKRLLQLNTTARQEIDDVKLHKPLYDSYFKSLLSQAAGRNQISTTSGKVVYTITDMSKLQRIFHPDCMQQSYKEYVDKKETVVGVSKVVCTDAKPVYITYMKGSEKLKVHFWYIHTGPDGQYILPS